MYWHIYWHPMYSHQHIRLLCIALTSYIFTSIHQTLMYWHMYWHPMYWHEYIRLLCYALTSCVLTSYTHHMSWHPMYWHPTLHTPHVLPLYVLTSYTHHRTCVMYWHLLCIDILHTPYVLTPYTHHRTCNEATRFSDFLSFIAVSCCDLIAAVAWCDAGLD